MVLLHVFLVAFGLANVYPFLWMLGTSFKSKSEANEKRQKPVPEVKYRPTQKGWAALPDDLSETQLGVLALLQGRQERHKDAPGGQRRVNAKQHSVENKLPLAEATRELAELAQKGFLRSQAQPAAYRFIDPRRGRFPYSLNTRQKELLHEALAKAGEAEPHLKPAPATARQWLRNMPSYDMPANVNERQKGLLLAMAGGSGAAPSASDYAGANGISREQAEAELNALVDMGALRMEEAEVRYHLTERGGGEIASGLRARPLHMIAMLRIADEAQKVINRTIVPSRMYPEEYAKKYDLYITAARGEPDETKAKRELAELKKAAPRLAPWLTGRAAAEGDGVDPARLQAVAAKAAAFLSTQAPSPPQYAQRYGLYETRREPDLGTARAELDALVSKDVLTSSRWQWRNYEVVLKDAHFGLYLVTSIIVTASVVLLTVLMTSMLGYALARLRFPGKMLVLSLLIIGAVAPREAVIIPIFRMLKSMGALDGVWGMVFWLTGVSIGNSFLMAGFFLTLPREVEEAAAVDGAGPFRTFLDVALPMARPIVLTVALFAFLTAWNSFLVPLLCTMARPSMQPLSVAVYTFQSGHKGLWAQVNAAAAIMIVPVILIFLVLQKHVVKSIAVGAVKG
jgi:raffinose/stachyose/melibiose transport system permease protein